MVCEWEVFACICLVWLLQDCRGAKGGHAKLNLECEEWEQWLSEEIATRRVHRVWLSQDPHDNSQIGVGEGKEVPFCAMGHCEKSLIPLISSCRKTLKVL